MINPFITSRAEAWILDLYDVGSLNVFKVVDCTIAQSVENVLVSAEITLSFFLDRSIKFDYKTNTDDVNVLNIDVNVGQQSSGAYQRNVSMKNMNDLTGDFQQKLSNSVEFDNLEKMKNKRIIIFGGHDMMDVENRYVLFYGTVNSAVKDVDNIMIKATDLTYQLRYKQVNTVFASNLLKDKKKAEALINDDKLATNPTYFSDLTIKTIFDYIKKDVLGFDNPQIKNVAQSDAYNLRNITFSTEFNNTTMYIFNAKYKTVLDVFYELKTSFTDHIYSKYNSTITADRAVNPTTLYIRIAEMIVIGFEAIKFDSKVHQFTAYLDDQKLINEPNIDNSYIVKNFQYERVDRSDRVVIAVYSDLRSFVLQKQNGKQLKQHYAFYYGKIDENPAQQLKNKDGSLLTEVQFKDLIKSKTIDSFTKKNPNQISAEALALDAKTVYENKTKYNKLLTINTFVYPSQINKTEMIKMGDFFEFTDDVVDPNTVVVTVSNTSGNTSRVLWSIKTIKYKIGPNGMSRDIEAKIVNVIK